MSEASRKEGGVYEVRNGGGVGCSDITRLISSSPNAWTVVYRPSFNRIVCFGTLVIDFPVGLIVILNVAGAIG